MAKNKLSDLRDHLFETIEALKDADNPMDIARAKTISCVAQTVINAAKLDLDAAAILGIDADGVFFPIARGGEKPRLVIANGKVS